MSSRARVASRSGRWRCWSRWCALLAVKAPRFQLHLQVPEKLEFLLEPIGTYDFRIMHGGRVGAKSWSVADALLYHGLQGGHRFLCAREYQASIKDSVHKLIADRIAFHQLEPYYLVQDQGIYGPGGTEFLFKGLRNNIREIKSTERVTVAWVEEAQPVSKTSWDTLIPTVRADGSEIWVTFNPELEKDETYQRMVVHPPARSRVVYITYLDNPFASAKSRREAEALRATDLEAYDHIWLGKPWTKSKASILADKCVVRDFDPGTWMVRHPQTGEMVLDAQGPWFGQDWGFANDPSITVKLWTRDRDLYIEYDAGGPGLDNDATAAVIRSVPGAEDALIRADSARPETINEMKKRGLRVVPCKKWDGSVKDGIAHLRSYRHIIIHPRCKTMQEEAKLYRYKVDDSTGDILPVPIDKHNHGWDAVRYGLGPLIKAGRQQRVWFSGMDSDEGDDEL